MIKEFKCPHCGHTNAINIESWANKFSEKLPENLGKAILIGTATILTGGIGGILAGVFLYGKSAVKYFGGTKIACASCSHNFTILIN